MQTVEAYLHEYFRKRTEMLRDGCERWKPHVQRFFAPNYHPYDQQKSVADSESERILSIEGADSSAEVLTSGCMGGRWRFRYRLSLFGGSWFITSMEMECGVCHGSGKGKYGKSDCKLCEGTGWKLIMSE